MMDVFSLRAAIARGNTFEYHFFWKGPLSQWEQKHPFVIDGLTYQTAEHWMMAAKAKVFNDVDTWRAILDAPSPKEAKELGRKVRNYNDEVWAQCRILVVIAGNMAKFGQHSDLAKLLNDTGQKVLVEASPHDTLWGIGVEQTHGRAYDPNLWPGQNLLGFSLMEVRERLRAEGAM